METDTLESADDLHKAMEEIVKESTCDRGRVAMETNWLPERLFRAQKPCKEKDLLLSNSLATALAALFQRPSPSCHA